MVVFLVVWLAAYLCSWINIYMSGWLPLWVSGWLDGRLSERITVCMNGFVFICLSGWNGRAYKWWPVFLVGCKVGCLRWLPGSCPLISTWSLWCGLFYLHVKLFHLCVFAFLNISGRVCVSLHWTTLFFRFFCLCLSGGDVACLCSSSLVSQFMFRHCVLPVYAPYICISVTTYNFIIFSYLSVWFSDIIFSDFNICR